MNNLEENLKKIKIREIGEEDKESLWHRIMTRYVEENSRKSFLSLSIFNFNMNKLIVGALALILVLGGGSMVAASNDAVPGDFLFPVDLAIEKIQIKLAGEENAQNLKLRFAEERIEEIKHVSEKKSEPAVLVTDLSTFEVSEIEAEVFTNETIVKIEAGNKKYGYVSALKTKAELVKEIAGKYSIPEEKVNTLINFSTEDRASRTDDKGFLNKTHSINFSEDESDDVGKALTDLEELLRDNDGNVKAQELEEALQEILVLLGDDAKLEIKKNGKEIRIESGNQKIDIKLKTEDNSGPGKSDSKDNSDDDDLDENSNNGVGNGDIKEDDSEVFCRGEWRDDEDCDDESLDDELDDTDDDSIDDDDEEIIDDSGDDEDEDELEDDESEDDDDDSSKSGKGRDDDEEDDD